MRYALLLVVALLAACNQSRTVTPEEAARIHADYEQRVADERATDRRFKPDAEPTVFVTPVYDAPIDTVQTAAVIACKRRFDKVDTDDRQAHCIKIHSSTAWAGSSDVVVQLSTNAGGQTVVTVTSDSWDSGGRPNRDLRAILANLDEEMQRAALTAAPKSSEDRLRELDALHVKGLVTDEEYAAKRKAILDGL
jgi:hypothetical protein